MPTAMDTQPASVAEVEKLQQRVKQLERQLSKLSDVVHVDGEQIILSCPVVIQAGDATADRVTLGVGPCCDLQGPFLAFQAADRPRVNLVVDQQVELEQTATQHDRPLANVGETYLEFLDGQGDRQFFLFSTGEGRTFGSHIPDRIKKPSKPSTDPT